MTYTATSYRKNPCPGGHEIYNLEDPSLVIITIYLVCLIYAGSRVKDIKRNNAFSLYNITYMARP